MMKKLKNITITLCLMLLCWGAGFAYFIYTSSHYQSKINASTDAIAVFGGQRQLLYVATSLLKSGYAPIVYVTGDKPSEGYKAYILSQNLAFEQFIFDDSNTLNLYNSKYSFPQRTAIFLDRYQFDSVRLITRASHIFRAALEIQQYTEANTIIILHPVKSSQDTLYNYFIEYNKYLYTLISSYI